MNSRDKGARGERDFAKFCRRWFPGARRGTNLTGQADNHGIFGYHVEVKWREKLNIWAALKQAEQDCNEAFEIPVVAFKRNQSRWYVALPAENFLNLVKAMDDIEPEGS